MHVNALTLGYLVDVYYVLSNQLNYWWIINAMSYVTLDHSFYGNFHNALQDTYSRVILWLKYAHEITVFWLSILTSEHIIALIRDTCKLESWSLFNGISRAIFTFIRLQYGLECEHWNLQQNFYLDLFILLGNMTIAHCGSSVQGCQLPLPTPDIIWFITKSNWVFTGLKLVYWSVPVNKLFLGANSELNALKVI